MNILQPLFSQRHSIQKGIGRTLGICSVRSWDFFFFFFAPLVIDSYLFWVPDLGMQDNMCYEVLSIPRVLLKSAQSWPFPFTHCLLPTPNASWHLGLLDNPFVTHSLGCLRPIHWGSTLSHHPSPSSIWVYWLPPCVENHEKH